MKKTLPIITIFSIILVAVPVVVFALEIKNPLQYDSIEKVIDAVVSFIATIGISIAVIVIIWAGILYMTSGSNESRLQSAKKTIMWAVIGAAILLSAKFITDLIASILGKI